MEVHYLLLGLVDALNQNFPASNTRTARTDERIKRPFKNSEWLHWPHHMKYGSAQGFGRSTHKRALPPLEGLILKAHFEKICFSSIPFLLWVPQSGSSDPEGVGNGASCLDPK